MSRRVKRTAVVTGAIVLGIVGGTVLMGVAGIIYLVILDVLYNVSSR